MKTYSYEIILADVTELTEAIADQIYQAGGDDTLPSSRDGIVTIAFDREANSWEEAIRSPLKTLHDAGFRTKTILTPAGSFA